jgi:hypothetical protein
VVGGRYGEMTHSLPCDMMWKLVFGFININIFQGS